MGPDVIWILIPLTALAIPIFAILTGPIKTRMAQAERREARKLYERIISEKLDVMKTALTMGYDRDDITDLDSRLERLVGSDKLIGLLEEKNPPNVPKVRPDSDLMDTDLEREIERLQRKREKQ